MTTQDFLLQVSPEIGKVSAAYTAPENPICVMTLAHGAGAGMHHSFMIALAEALAEKNIASLRFNFPFLENKKGRPDAPAIAHKTIAIAAQHAKEKYPSLPALLSGKSFGGRMSSQLMALQFDASVKGLVFYGFPLHPIKKPSTDRAEHLQQIKQPMLFLQGTKDTLAEWPLIEEVCASLPNATLVKLEGANHAFKKGKEDLIPLLAAQTREWVGKILK
jgi:predicted alpha/beta-hydrolase family hydrolase